MSAKTKYGLFLAAFFLMAAFVYAAPTAKISSKQLQGIWEVTKQGEYHEETKKIPFSEGAPSPGELFFITQPDILGRWKLEGGGGKGRSYFEFRESDACVMASIDAVSGKPDPCDPSQYFSYYTEANKVYVMEPSSVKI